MASQLDLIHQHRQSVTNKCLRANIQDFRGFREFFDIKQPSLFQDHHSTDTNLEMLANLQRFRPVVIPTSKVRLTSLEI